MSSCCCYCCCSASSLAKSSRHQCQELPLKELTIITVQPHNSSSNNLSSNLRLVERPNIIGSWSCDEEFEHYNVDDCENRTPTMWRAWWLQGANEPLPTAIHT
ncbi:uncharacterized protein LOC108658548 [Drosophila navojoa]|nr:uncharacterized protein LOC108658548 [Drosophila navojoa]